MTAPGHSTYHNHFYLHANHHIAGSNPEIVYAIVLRISNAPAGFWLKPRATAGQLGRRGRRAVPDGTLKAPWLLISSSTATPTLRHFGQPPF